MKNFNLEKYKKLREETELEYEKIVSINCPALQAEVVFNSDGFHHLRYDTCRVERHKKSQYSKFLYLPVLQHPHSQHLLIIFHQSFLICLVVVFSH